MNGVSKPHDIADLAGRLIAMRDELVRVSLILNELRFQLSLEEQRRSQKVAVDMLFSQSERRKKQL